MRSHEAFFPPAPLSVSPASAAGFSGDLFTPRPRSIPASSLTVTAVSFLSDKLYACTVFLGANMKIAKQYKGGFNGQASGPPPTVHTKPNLRLVA